ncbi:MAG: N(4)-(beta-N-acetylglucosaminyl)-L-asparaginase [Acidobacteria bacterium]|nr:N(4)-(beta-N-acetylglucosaminyl)-L-asparaginase [Acidobacteriota bacterium]
MTISRRNFLKAGTVAGLSVSTGEVAQLGRAQRPNPQRPVVIASSNKIRVEGQEPYYNGLRATAKALELIRQGRDTLEAVVAGVNIVEDDPNDDSVGYGGLPNEEGEVELDSSVMHGPTGRAGSVAALKYIKNPSSVAKLVIEHTDHVMLVGDGALRFALSYGFPKQDLLTEHSRKVWLRWREERSDKDDWGPSKVKIVPEAESAELRCIREMIANLPTGTMNCVAVNEKGELSGVTTTSGLAFKIPGRVGDSPIIGAGLYVDNEVGAAGSTGRGEEVIRICGAHTIIENMRHAMTPVDACLDALKRIMSYYKGRPDFQVKFYALNKQGEYAGAAIWDDAELAVSDARGSRIEPCAYLYKRPKK